MKAVIPFKVELGAVRSLFRSPTIMATTHEYVGIFRNGLLGGRFLLPEERFGEGTTSVVLDEALAREQSDEPLTLLGTEFDGVRNGKKFRGKVVGVLRDPISLRKHLGVFDSQASARTLQARRLEFRNIYLPIDAAQEDPSGIVLQAHSVDEVDQVADRAYDVLSAEGVEPWLHVQKTVGGSADRDGGSV